MGIANWMVDYCCAIQPDSSLGQSRPPPPDAEYIFHSFGPDLFYAEVEFKVPRFSLPNGYTVCPEKTTYIVGIWGGLGGADSGTATYTYNGTTIPIKGVVQNQPILWQAGIELNIDCVTKFPKPIKSISAWEQNLPQQPHTVTINAGTISENDVIDVQISFGKPACSSITLSGCIMVYRVFDETTGSPAATGMVPNAYTTKATCTAQDPNNQCFGWGTAEAFVEGPTGSGGAYPIPFFSPIAWTKLYYQDYYALQNNIYNLLTKNFLDSKNDQFEFQISNKYLASAGDCEDVKSKYTTGGTTMATSYTWVADPSVQDSQGIYWCEPGQ